MGLRVKRDGPLSTMVVVGRVVGTLEPALVIPTMAHANSASARTKTIAPSQPAGRSTGRNGKGHEPVESKPDNDGKPPCKRWPNNDLRGICGVMHGGNLVYVTLQTEPLVPSIWWHS